MLATGLVTTVQPRAAISSSSVAVEPDAVGEHGALAQQPEPVEVGGGAHAVGGDAVLDLLLGLGEVDLDRQPALGAELGDPAQRVLADRVDRVRGEGGRDRRPEPVQVLEAAQRRLPHPAPRRRRGRTAAPRSSPAGRRRRPRGRSPPGASTCPRSGWCRCGSSRRRPGARPSRRPRRSSFASTGQIRSCSQGISGRSPPLPRNSVIAAWVWPLTSGATRGAPAASIVSSPGLRPRPRGRAPRSARPRSARPTVSPSRTAPVTVSAAVQPLTDPPLRAAAAPPPGRRAGGSRWRCGRPPARRRRARPSPTPLARLSTTQSAA